MQRSRQPCYSMTSSAHEEQPCRCRWRWGRFIAYFFRSSLYASNKASIRVIALFTEE
jgi:hypothetical protein